VKGAKGAKGAGDMAWEVRLLPEFNEWFAGLEDRQQDDVAASLAVLAEFGPQLGRPRADTLKGAKHANMKELRVQSGGRPIRCLFAFDPKRRAVVLLGGDKGGDRRWYADHVPIADARFAAYLKTTEE